MRFITNVSSERSCFFAPCAGCVLPVTYMKCDGQPNRSSKPYSVLRNYRPSSAGWGILSVDEDNLARLGDHLHLMSGDMGDHSIMIVLPSGPRARDRSLRRATLS